MQNATVLVTGGSGFIGSHVVDALIQAGARPRIFDMEPSPYHSPAAVRTCLGQLGDREALEEAMRDDVSAMLAIEKRLEERVVGQDQALATVAQRLRTYHAGMGEPGKPVGVFLFSGPSGVGKTETAIALAETLYGGERNMIVVNMSEYQEAHSVSRLKGSSEMMIEERGNTVGAMRTSTSLGIVTRSSASLASSQSSSASRTRRLTTMCRCSPRPSAIRPTAEAEALGVQQIRP